MSSSEPQMLAYKRIEEHLRMLIADAKPDDQLPGDRELSEQFRVSRMTARQAVSTLVGEGKVYRVKGSGTYVSPHRVHRRIERLLSFHEHMQRHHIQASARVLGSGVRPGSAEENADLGQAAGSQVCHVRRILIGDAVPIALEQCLLPIDCRPVLDRDLAEVSLHAALAGIGRRPERSMGTLAAESASPEVARLLDVAIGAALIVQRQIILDHADRPAEVALVRYVGDRFVFDIDQVRQVVPDPGREASYVIASLRS